SVAPQSPTEPTSPTAKDFWRTALSELNRHKAPVIFLICIGLCHRLLLLLPVVALLWSGAEWLYPKLPLAARLRIKSKVRQQWLQSSWYTEIAEGIAQMRPFILIALYFWVPLALI